jgi:chromosome segregation ATPase
MSEIISQIAQINVPQDVLQNADFDGIVNDFRRHFRRLDDFQRIHGPVGMHDSLQPLWQAIAAGDHRPDSSDLEVSALSKTLGQLIVLSVVQSQQIQRQQDALGSQQTATRTLQQKVKQAHATLAEHQQAQSVHNTEMQQVMHQLLEVRNGLVATTQRVTEAAQDGQKTREELQAQIHKALTEATARVDTACEWVQTIADAQNTKVETLRNTVHADTDARDQAERLLADDLSLMQRQLDHEHNRVEDMGDLLSQHRMAQDVLQSRLGTLTEERAAEQARMQDRLNKLTLGIAGASGLALIGLMLAVTRFMG